MHHHPLTRWIHLLLSHKFVHWQRQILLLQNPLSLLFLSSTAINNKVRYNYLLFISLWLIESIDKLNQICCCCCCLHICLSVIRQIHLLLSHKFVHWQRRILLLQNLSLHWFLPSTTINYKVSKIIVLFISLWLIKTIIPLIQICCCCCCLRIRLSVIRRILLFLLTAPNFAVAQLIVALVSTVHHDRLQGTL